MAEGERRSQVRHLLVHRPHRLVPQMARYLVAGLLALAVDLLTLFALRDFGLHHQLHALAGFSTGMVVSFWLSRRWVFAHEMAYSVWVSFALATFFTAVGVVLNAGVNEAVWQWLAARPELPIDLRDAPLVAKLPAAVLVMAWNFVGRRLVVFRIPPEEAGG